MGENVQNSWFVDYVKVAQPANYSLRRRFQLLVCLTILAICVLTLWSRGHIPLGINDFDTVMSRSLASNEWPLPVLPAFEKIYNDTLGFHKIFALNLPSRSDKRDRLTLSAAFTNMSIEFLDGVTGDQVSTKALPWGQEKRTMADPFIGSWRSHLNAIRKVVYDGLGSALILEDDADWDIRVRDQLVGLAVGTRGLMNQSLTKSHQSPFGSHWDVLWIGHCMERENLPGKPEYIIPYDPTTPTWENYIIGQKEYMKTWPAHSRRIRYTHNPLCTTAYAVSQQGARKLSWALSVKELTGNFDNALQEWCLKGVDDPICLTSQPTYFYMHKPRMAAGKGSDNNPQDQGAVTVSRTHNIRLSVSMNIDNLVVGKNLTDFWPDDQPPGSVKPTF